MFNFHYKINCCQSYSYQIAYAVNNEGFFMGPTQGPYKLQLYMGPSYFWGVWPLLTPLFRTLKEGHTLDTPPTLIQKERRRFISLSKTVHTIRRTYRIYRRLLVVYRGTDGLAGTGLMPYKAHSSKYQHFILFSVRDYVLQWWRRRSFKNLKLIGAFSYLLDLQELAVTPVGWIINK